jgi:aspartate/glutamate racemase
VRESSRSWSWATALTMNSSAIREALKGYDVEAFAPNDEERMAIVDLIGKLQAGTADGTSERISQLSKAAFGRRSRGRRVACLACTELPLAFSASKRHGYVRSRRSSVARRALCRARPAPRARVALASTAKLN